MKKELDFKKYNVYKLAKDGLVAVAKEIVEKVRRREIEKDEVPCFYLQYSIENGREIYYCKDEYSNKVNFNDLSPIVISKSNDRFAEEI